MKTRFLFSHKFKKVGWFIFIPALFMGVIYLLFDSDLPDILKLSGKTFAIVNDEFFSKTQVFKWIKNDLSDEVISVLLLIGAFLVGFSKERIEDEYITKLRLESIVWSVFVNYFVLFLAVIFIYGEPFFYVMIINLFAILVLYIFRFNIILYRNSKSQIS